MIEYAILTARGYIQDSVLSEFMRTWPTARAAMDFLNSEDGERYRVHKPQIVTVGDQADRDKGGSRCHADGP
jgi:hypothetical protein